LHLPSGETRHKSEAPMQIRDDQEPLSETTLSRRRETAPLQRLVRRNPAEDETVRLPMNVVAFWLDSLDTRLGTFPVRLSIPENLDDEDTLSLVPRKNPD
jgi:hypothetical protein